MKVKRQKMKAIPRHYQKATFRNLSNSSISQLIQIASYRKRINDLSQNNRLLATALQESRVEAAIQNNFLKDYARDSNQILFARLKLNEMAKNLARFVMDLEEVRNYLNIRLPTDNNPFQKGSSSDKIIRVPAINCIEELTELPSETEASTTETFSVGIQTTDLVSSQVSENKKSDVSSRNLEGNTASVNDDVEMAPILFVGDNGEKQKKHSSRSRYSKISNDADKESLTPKLNIDFQYMKDKRGSVCQMSPIIVTNSRSTRSRGKSASKKEKALEKSITPVPPSLTPQKRNSLEISETENVFKGPFDENGIKHNKNLKNSLQNYSKIAVSSDHNNCSDIPISSLIINKEKTIPLSNLPLKSNCTVSLCESIELTEEFHPTHQIIENNFSFVDSSLHKSEINDNISKKDMESDSVKELLEKDTLKLGSSPQNTSILFNDDENDQKLSEINEYDEIQNVGSLTFCESNSSSDDDDEYNGNIGTVSPITKDSTVKPTVRKKNSDKKSSSSISDKLHEKISVEYTSVHEIATKFKEGLEPDYSVYNLDVSNLSKERKKTKEKSSRKSKGKKISNKNGVTKPLLSKCSIAKLKGEAFKFRKNETSMKLNSVNKTPKTIFQSPCISPGGILKKTQSDTPQSSKQKVIPMPLNEVEYGNNMQTNTNCIKQQDALETPKSESKRVSFAPTDLVCSFRKMSVSRTIADNRKVRRTSKSVLDFDELFEEDNQLETSRIDVNYSSQSTQVQKSENTVLFDFSSDTEQCTFTILSNSRVSTLPNKQLVSPKLSANTVPNQTNIENKHAKITYPKLKSPLNTGKLSLKSNKSPKNIMSQKIDKTKEKTDIFLLESPICVVKPPKRKSLFKESTDVYLKENINFEQQTLEKLKDTLQEKLHTDVSSPLSTEIEHIENLSNSKCQTKANSKVFIRKNKLSDKAKQLQPIFGMKNNKTSLEIKYEDSPVLKDTTNLKVIPDEIIPKRRSKPVNYKEPSLHKKLRRK